jgi:hypothetical protein
MADPSVREDCLMMYWDAARIEEDHRTAFASEIGRTNVENW